MTKQAANLFNDKGNYTYKRDCISHSANKKFFRFIIVILLPKYNVVEDTEIKTKRNIGMYRI